MGREITSDEAAELAGVARKTFSGYVARSQAPKPIRHVGRTPVWDEDEIKVWKANRPGRGDHATGAERTPRRTTASSSSDED
ncbi:MAG: helix-turn-helix transcriptional regulator [Nocardioides sp.]